MNTELTLALAKFFCDAWYSFIVGPSEEMEALIEYTALVEQVIATAEDIDNGDAPEDCEIGDTYHVLSKLGHEAWELGKGS